MFKSGFITIVGLPNAGKSTLINSLVGERVAIVSWRPQTTRNKIIGIMNGEDYQAVFIDTPGIHNSKNTLSKYMMKAVDSALDGVDCVLYVVSADKPINDRDIENTTKYSSTKTKFILILNKCDMAERAEIVKKIETFSKIKNCQTIIPLSAKTGKNMDDLKLEVIKSLKEGVPYYPEEMFTDKDMRFMVAEIIREKALKFLSEEIPYGIGVSVLNFKEGKNGITHIDVEIICEKQAHKGIVIGKGGEMLKKISTTARLDIEKMLDGKVFLEIWVRVKEDWRDNESVMRDLGYDNKSI